MKKHREDLLKKFKHPNKEYEKKAKEIFSEMFDEEERIEENFNKNNPNYEHNGLDGGCSKELRDNAKKYFRMLEKLKRDFKITDK